MGARDTAATDERDARRRGIMAEPESIPKEASVSRSESAMNDVLRFVVLVQGKTSI
jgi:hypothetical protein